MTAQDVQFVSGFEPGYLGRITQMHGEFYAQDWGSGPLFEALMGRELCDFCEGFREDRDLLLTAHVEGELVGCIAVMDKGDGVARLRWFLLAPACQGRGIGRELLTRALEFCRETGYKSVYLWTVENQEKACRLYESAGFRLVESVPDERYTLPQVNLRYELEL